jgi:hypothetical protein
MNEKSIHYFLKENMKLSDGGHGYKEISLSISDEKISIYDIIDDIHSDGFEYEYNRTIIVESKYFKKIIECINEKYNINIKLTNINQRIIFESIYLAYKNGGIENITSIFEKNKIEYKNHVYSRQDSSD